MFSFLKFISVVSYKALHIYSIQHKLSNNPNILFISLYSFLLHASNQTNHLGNHPENETVPEITQHVCHKNFLVR